MIPDSSLNISKLIRKIDLFGYRFTFEENDNQSYKTTFGGLFTILLIISITIIGFIFGKEIYERKIPIVSFSEEVVQYSRINLTDVPIMFNVKHNGDINSIEELNSKFEFEFILYERLFGQEESSIRSYFYGLELCNEDSFPAYTQLVADYMKVKEDQKETLYCIPETYKYYFQNAMAAPNSTLIYININVCDPDKDGCIKDFQHEIAEKSLLIKLNFLNSFVDPKNYTYPIQYFIDNINYWSAENLIKTSYFMFTENIIKSDNGWILEDIKTETHIALKNSRDDFKYEFDSRKLIQFSLESPTKRQRVDRSYIKVQELFAKIGGLFNAFLMISQVLLYNYTKFKFILDVFEITWGKSYKKIYNNIKEEANPKLNGNKKDFNYKSDVNNNENNNNSINANSIEINKTIKDNPSINSALNLNLINNSKQYVYSKFINSENKNNNRENISSMPSNYSNNNLQNQSKVDKKEEKQIKKKENKEEMNKKLDSLLYFYNKGFSNLSEKNSTDYEKDFMDLCSNYSKIYNYYYYIVSFLPIKCLRKYPRKYYNLIFEKSSKLVSMHKYLTQSFYQEITE